MFQKGHQTRKGQKNPNAGRKPKLSTDIRAELQGKPERVRDLLIKLYEAGMNGNTDAAKFYIEMVLGKARQPIDQTVKGIILTPNDYDSLARQLIEYERLLPRDTVTPDVNMADMPRLIEGEQRQQSQPGKDTDKIE